MLIAIAPLALTAGGCMVGPKYARPALEPPAAFALPRLAESRPIPADWWRLYREPALDALIATATRPIRRSAGGRARR
jgi:outer membrane protein TolC